LVKIKFAVSEFGTDGNFIISILTYREYLFDEIKEDDKDSKSGSIY
jgi:hypothetical protein